MASRLQQFRGAVSRLYLVVGMTIASTLLGAVIAAPVVVRLAALRPSPLRFALSLFAGQCWAWLVLPGISYATARVVPLSRWASVAAAASLGTSLHLFLRFVSVGVGGILSDRPALIGQLFLIGVGTFLSERAARRGLADSERAQAAAEKIAEARRAEYAEMMRASESLAERGTTTAAPGESKDKAG